MPMLFKTPKMLSLHSAPPPRVLVTLAMVAQMTMWGGCGSNPPTSENASPSTSVDPSPNAAAAKEPEAPQPVHFSDLNAAVAALYAAAEERDSEQMARISEWIAKSHGAEAQPAMKQKALDSSAALEMRIAACGVLRELGPVADESLTTIVNEADQSLVAANALKSIVMLRPVPAGLLDRLMGWMEHEDLQVQRAAIQSLARIGEKAESAAPKLLAILNNPDANETLRGEAKRALKAVNPRRTFQD